MSDWKYKSCPKTVLCLGLRKFWRNTQDKVESKFQYIWVMKGQTLSNNIFFMISMITTTFILLMEQNEQFEYEIQTQCWSVKLNHSSTRSSVFVSAYYFKWIKHAQTTNCMTEWLSFLCETKTKYSIHWPLFSAAIESEWGPEL